ncbi:sensor histidine kinase [Mucilaginibacter sp. SJ]|uniref:sensor histidine kinase n=1 Tax=Mucilaginibacter sp. SJ TaxID=3029053 RepID=UPI0023A91A7F|nr:sensor histidine kinase [Mucilaginibacter sp. SJ]WEA00724.1 histidine kinase [Mucilaginibacter sp. SJ]
MSINEKYKTALNHSVWWLAFYIYEVGIFYMISGAFPNASQNLVYYGINIGLFYSQKNILDLSLGDAPFRKYWKLVLYTAIELAICMIIKLGIDYIFTDGKRQLKLFKEMAGLDIYRSVFFMGLASLYWTALNIHSFRKRALEAEISHLKSASESQELKLQYEEARNIYLQQQINPHMLFNSLNFVYNTVYKYNLEAADSIEKLAEIMHYTYQEPGNDGKKSLEQELQQIGNMISINRVRYDYDLDIRFNTDGDTAGHRIIPLVLMTLVENIFKHGDLKSNPVTIAMDISPVGKMTFFTQNYKTASNTFNRLKSVGIENIQKRLQYAYGTNYSLKFEENRNTFESHLTIFL